MDEDSVATCQPCPSGSHQGDSGQVSCIPCPEGFTTINTGSYDQNQCKGKVKCLKFCSGADNVPLNDLVKIAEIFIR